MPVRTIDEYLATLPEAEQIVLDDLRHLIKSAAPEAEEAINYGMPMFRFHGMLVGFAAAKKHLAFYICSHRVAAHFAADLVGFDHSGITVRFQKEKPLPEDLVKKLVLIGRTSRLSPRRWWISSPEPPRS